MANRNMEKLSASLTNREVNIRNIVRYCFTSARMVNSIKWRSGEIGDLVCSL